MLRKGILVAVSLKVYDTLIIIRTLQRPTVTGLQLMPISWSERKKLVIGLRKIYEVSVLKKFCSQQTGEEALEKDIHQL